MSVLQVFILPGKRQTSHGTSKNKGSCLINCSSWKGSEKFRDTSDPSEQIPSFRFFVLFLGSDDADQLFIEVNVDSSVEISPHLFKIIDCFIGPFAFVFQAGYILKLFNK